MLLCADDVARRSCWTRGYRLVALERPEGVPLASRVVGPWLGAPLRRARSQDQRGPCGVCLAK